MRYYFHLREAGGHLVDEEGLELRSKKAVEAAATAGARSILAAEVIAGRLPLAAVIEVYDEYGQRVLDLPFRDTVVLDG
jgi:hypothetical protein